MPLLDKKELLQRLREGLRNHAEKRELVGEEVWEEDVVLEMLDRGILAYMHWFLAIRASFHGDALLDGNLAGSDLDVTRGKVIAYREIMSDLVSVLTMEAPEDGQEQSTFHPFEQLVDDGPVMTGLDLPTD